MKPEEDKSVQEVRSVLHQFQEGYARRDIATLDAFMELFSSDSGIEIIGTGGLEPTKGEWCVGRAAVRKLIDNDWRFWGNLKLDEENARITILGEVAWLSADATVTYEITAERFYSDAIKEIQAVLERKDIPVKVKLTRIQLEASEMIFETSRGDVYVWPLRCSAVLIKQNDLWCFHQIHFSHPTLRLPDARLPII